MDRMVATIITVVSALTKRLFAKPDFDANTQDVYLEFCGVNATATVLLNGQKSLLMTAAILLFVPM